MALPRVATPTYELTIPSTGQKIKYRPFLLKEEKILMMASETGGASVTKAVKDILGACCQSKIDIKTLAPFDIEYFFLQLRGRSVGEEISIKLRKPDSIECEDKNCEETCEVNININEITIDTENVSDGKIEITKDIGIKLRYPELDQMSNWLIGEKVPTTDEAFELICSSIEYIWEGEEIFKAKDSTKKELADFIESLDSTQFGKVRGFFENMPKLSKEVTWTCSKCEKSAPLRLEGIDSFLG